jgi:hypothetical protein
MLLMGVPGLLLILAFLMIGYAVGIERKGN